ncbi:MAG: hypothetical protein Q7T80_08870 [Methanoregula sp.]|nr:hypothetical protein [Methanoregula sp.]
MKKEIIIGVCLLAVIIAGMIVFIPGYQSLVTGAENSTVGQPSPTLTAESSEIAGRISHNVALNPSLSMAGGAKETKKILVYKTLPPIVTNETTLDYAKKFNVTGTLRGGAVVQSKDLRYGIEISKNSGSIRYVDQDRPNKRMDAPEKLPTDDEAVKIATKFLKDRDLYPEGAAFSKIFRENAINVGGGEYEKVMFGQIGIWFNRTLNGMKVDGTQLVVYVGGNGDVIGYYANWRNYEPYKEYPITPPQVAFDKLKTKGIPVGMNNPDTSASIDEMYLAYETTAGAYKEDYLKPVWVFKGNVMVDGKSAMPIEQYIPALTDESMKSLSLS